MTDGILSTLKNFTGAEFKGGCPWRPLMVDPLVREVRQAWPFYEKGTLALYRPDPSHRLMEGLRVFEQARDACKGTLARLDADAARMGRKPS